MKTKEDVNRVREIINRLEKLGLPEKTLKELREWVDKEEEKLKKPRELCQACSCGIGEYFINKETVEYQKHNVCPVCLQAWGRLEKDTGRKITWEEFKQPDLIKVNNVKMARNIYKLGQASEAG